MGDRDDGFRPWPQKEIDRYFASLPDWDGPTDWSDSIDRYVYSEEQIFGRRRDPQADP